MYVLDPLCFCDATAGPPIEIHSLYSGEDDEQEDEFKRIRQFQWSKMLVANYMI